MQATLQPVVIVNVVGLLRNFISINYVITLFYGPVVTTMHGQNVLNSILNSKSHQTYFLFDLALTVI